MKKITLLFALVSVWLFSFAQVSTPSTPQSFTHYLNKAVPTYYLPSVDETKLLKEDQAEQTLDKAQPLRFGQDFDVHLDLSNAGVWENLQNGDRVWRLEIVSQGAKSLNFIFNKFHMPQGGEFFIYNEDRTYVIGAFTALNNKSHGGFSTAPVKGSTVILEYYEPLAVKNQGVIAVSSIVHAYRDMFATAQGLNKNFGDSGSCNIDVNCPQSAGWEDEIRSVAMIITSGNTRWCSGAMINNTAEDKTPYFLTADHCLDGNENNWIFVFNYQSPTCNGVDGSLVESLSGSTTKATYGNADMALLELSLNVPEAYNVHFSGWDKSGVAPTSTTGIHHPAGDVKKISFDNDPSIDGTFYNSDHWQVSAWDLGTTEGGSSGSPLYDQNHRIVGQLHGGLASCTNITLDEYGKVSASWNGGGTASSQLMAWLDPLGLGVSFLDGNSFSCGASGLAATSTTNSAILTWNANIDTITNFVVRYRVQGSGAAGWTTINLADTLLSTSITGLTPCTDYQFQVNMDCDSVWSGFSTAFNFTTDGCCTAPTGFVMSNMTDTTATITGVAVTAAVSYTMRYREQGTTAWTPITGLTLPTYNFTGLTPCSIYEVQFRTICVGTSTGFGNTFTFNSGCGQCVSLPYCTSEGNSIADEWIEEVILNTINNNSGTATSGYTDFTTITTTLNTGQTYNISLSQGYSGTVYTEHFNVWIDFDQSGTFDPSELVYTSGATTTFPNTGTITIPATATLGGTRMRVSMKYNSDATECETFAYGEVEDYCVTIATGSGGTSCDVPMNLTMPTIAPSGAVATWNNVPTANSYRLRYREVGTNQWQFLSNITQTSQLITGLSFCTNYEVQVRSNCGNGLNSNYSVSTNFTTLCQCDPITDLDTVQVNSTTATINWTSSTNAQSYEIEFKEVGNTMWSLVTTTDTVFQILNLLPATDYEVRVKAICPNIANSMFSNIVTFYTDWTTNTNSLPIDIERFEAYPNPFENQISLMISSLGNQEVTIEIFNIEGKNIQTDSRSLTQGLNTLNLSTEQFTSGMYILRLVTEKGVVSKRILKK